MSGSDGSASLPRKMLSTLSASSEAASQGVTRASIALQSLHEQSELARHWHVCRARCCRFGIAAAIGNRIDERRFGNAILAEDVARQILNLSAAAGHAPRLPGAGEAVLTAQDAVDLLRLEARKLFRRR